MRRSEAFLGLAALLVVALCAGPALADDEKIRIGVTVTHVSDADDGVDPKARPLLDALEDNKIRYKSATVVREVDFDLAPGDGGSVEIDGARKAHLQLMQVDARGALVAVDVDGGVKVDAKVRRGGRGFVVDAGKVGDGRRLLEIEAE